MTHYRNTDIDGLKVFYREAGDASLPFLLLCMVFRPRPSCFES